MTPSDPIQLMLLAAAWLLFGVSHSLLAGPRLERWFGRYGRLVFNTVSLLVIALPVGLLLAWPAHPLWQEGEVWRLVRQGLMVAALLGFVHTLKFYSLPAFLGLRVETWPLTFSPWHCWVRHPWYFLGLVLVWTQTMTDTWLVSAVCITLYVVVGSRIEEQRLLHYHPGSYAAYRRIVPGLIPWRGRVLVEDVRLRLEAQALAEG